MRNSIAFYRNYTENAGVNLIKWEILPAKLNLTNYQGYSFSLKYPFRRMHSNVLTYERRTSLPEIKANRLVFWVVYGARETAGDGAVPLWTETAV